MTSTNTDAAREAAAIEIWEFGVRKEIAREYANAAIDTFLAKVLEGADEKLAEIRERNKALGGHFPRNTLSTMHLWANELYADNTALLTLVAALSAKLKEVEGERLAVLEDRARFPDKPDQIGRMIEAHIGNLKAAKEAADKHAINAMKQWSLLAAQLTAQKAAHAKMLRDEADKLHKHGRWESARHILRLADKIEGED